MSKPAPVMGRRVGTRLVFADWSAPDPYSEELDAALHAARYSPGALTDTQRHLILSAAEAYLHFAGHPAPNRSILRQLADLRRTAKGIPRD